MKSAIPNSLYDDGNNFSFYLHRHQNISVFDKGRIFSITTIPMSTRRFTLRPKYKLVS
jgi:hypothetical protein